ETICPSESPEPEALSAIVSGALPCVGVAVSAAIGREFTGTVTVAGLAPPLWSMTETVAVQLPAAYVWVAAGPACGPTIVPSPKSNRNDAAVPSGPTEPKALAVTARGATPDAGVIVSCAGRNSSAPRSAKLTGPMPTLGSSGA